MRFPRSIRRFSRYSAVGVSTFLLDLAMLYAATSVCGIPYLVTTPVSFLIAVSLNYMLSRKIAFPETERSWHVGYAYFMIVAVIGAVATTGMVAVLVAYAGLFYLTARIIAATLVGFGNYLFNLHVNFDVAGRHRGRS